MTESEKQKRLSIGQSGKPNRSWKTMGGKRKVYQMEASKLTMEAETLWTWGWPVLRAISPGWVRREPKLNMARCLIAELWWTYYLRKECFLHRVPKSVSCAHFRNRKHQIFFTLRVEIQPQRSRKAVKWDIQMALQSTLNFFLPELLSLRVRDNTGSDRQ